MAADTFNSGTCRCGAVQLEFDGAPIVSNRCACLSCQAAGRLLESLAGAPAILETDGTTPFVLYRKDHCRCAHGAEHLAEHRLTPDSPTRRVVATCCNTAMFLDFTKGHWVSVYRQRVAHGAETAKSGLFVVRLLLAWARMGFRRPTLNLAKRKLPDIHH
jgi:hypothetical protein